ncbi:hypothetical protein YC2023_031808 [Brassica napus]
MICTTIFTQSRHRMQSPCSAPPYSHDRATSGHFIRFPCDTRYHIINFTHITPHTRFANESCHVMQSLHNPTRNDAAPKIEEDGAIVQLDWNPCMIKEKKVCE